MAFRLATTQHGDGVDVVSHWSRRALESDVFGAMHCHCTVEWIEEDGRRWTPDELWAFVQRMGDEVAQHEAGDFSSVLGGPRRHPLDRRA